jgi:hypothetical protein
LGGEGLPDLTDEQWQKIIDQVVDATLGTSTKDAAEDPEALFCTEADHREWPYGKEIQLTSYVSDYDVAAISELQDWESYDFDEALESDEIINADRLTKFSTGVLPTGGEYRKFLAWWVTWRLEHPDWSIVPICDLQELFHSDGRSCVLILSDKEGGPLPTPVAEQLYGFFKTKDAAFEFLLECGLPDTHAGDKEQVAKFVDRNFEFGLTGRFPS